MARKKISRNDPCPCGSGRKFKHCCLGKDIDWETRQAAGTKLPFVAPRPKPAPLSGYAALGPYRVVDARLKEVAKGTPGAAGWKTLVERLSETTPDEERIKAYRAIREARVLPDNAASFLIGHAIQWMPSEEAPEEDAKVGDGDALDRQALAVLRRHHADDLADLYANDRLEYDRRYERGRQFYYGPPDEELAGHLRKKGIID